MLCRKYLTADPPPKSNEVTYSMQMLPFPFGTWHVTVIYDMHGKKDLFNTGTMNE
jgi:hypothetical protein